MILSVLLLTATVLANDAAVARRAVELYGSGSIEALRPLLADGLVFLDGTERGGVEALSSSATSATRPALTVSWAGFFEKTADVRGSWTREMPNGETQEGEFAIELTFDAEGKIVRWESEFPRFRLRKPVRASGLSESDHFRIVYDPGEIAVEEIERLRETAEHYYAKTARYLNRSFPEGYRLHLNVSSAFDAPYASDPGDDAFILVSVRSAQRRYGFSLVHELVHNLMGLSRLMTESESDATPFGNRLLDEGFAVFVEEQLNDGARVFPNFGQEIHESYLALLEEAGSPPWPVLEAETYRAQPREPGQRRLAYMQHASFCKYLVETHGLEKFLRFFARGLDRVPEIYGVPFAELEADWREFLRTRGKLER